MSYAIMRMLHHPVEGMLRDFYGGSLRGAYEWSKRPERALTFAEKIGAERRCAVAERDYGGAGFDFHIVEI
jgi:hypothetical protein